MLNKTIEPLIPINKTVTNKQFDEILNGVAIEYNTSTNIAIIGIFATLQAGGTSDNRRSNVKITIEKIPFESSTINKIIKSKAKGITPRQFAKQFANDILKVSIKYQIRGNAYIYIKRFYNETLTGVDTANECYWLSDFQSDNPICPEYLKAALLKRFTDKFRKPSK